MPRARTQSHCFVCGTENSKGLQIRYDTTSDGIVSARWTASPACEGFEGVVHGGILATLLDEAMSKAVVHGGSEALTAELRVRYRHHVASGERLVIKGWVVEKTKRLIRTEAILETEGGERRAHAWATFLEVSNG